MEKISLTDSLTYGSFNRLAGGSMFRLMDGCITRSPDGFIVCTLIPMGTTSIKL